MKIRLLVVTGWCLAAPLAGQSQPQTDERQQVLAVVQQLFDGMRVKDTAKMRATLHPDARLIATGVREGTPFASLVAPTQWFSGVASANASKLDERLRNPVVQVDQGLASVWTEYTFYVDDRLSHCGVDLFHLVKLPEGWRIIDLADTRRREGCPP
jgi:hypothetical protein